uniref:Putative membrane peptidase ydiL n=2 Tax=Anthurium amnicola TaxID=1678845 RepID=A0A1D1XXE8_9ARAE
MAGSCHCSAQLPLLTLSSAVSPKFPVWRRRNCRNLVTPISRSSHRLQSSVLTCKSANKKWRLVNVACFKHVEEEGEGEESSSNANRFKIVEDKQNEGPIKAHPDQLVGNSKVHWISKIQKVLDKFFRSHGEPWKVPWSTETIFQVVLLWIASFWFIGSWIIPFLAHAAGFSKESLTYRGQALYSLLTDIVEGLAGIAILHRCLARFRPLPSGWFHFSVKGNWQFDVALGCLMFPLVNRLSQLNIDMVPMIPAPPGGVSSVEQSILARDPVAMALYAVVVSVCAPVWEEIVFRGFLLPSLTRYMSLRWSIVVSAVAFALAHFNVQRLLPLVFLGVVMGAVFARTRNLLPSMLLHSLWNGFVFLDLMR